MADENPTPSREDLILDLNFVPTWARKAPTEHPYAAFQETERDGTRRGRRWEDDDRGARGPRSGGSRPPRRGGKDGGFRRRDEGEGVPVRVPHSGAAAQSAPQPRPAPPRDERPDTRRWSAGPAEPPLAADVAFLPERTRLGAVAHRVRATRRAYPLAQLAEIFLGKAEFYHVKIDLHPAPPQAAGRGAAANQPSLVQCVECQALFRDRDTALRHVVLRHAEDIFDVRELTEEPPSGAFSCVARCPRSGRLLGPPNHHGFAATLAETHAELYPGESIDEYRNRLEMVRDPAAIEQWKKEFSTRKVYVLKSAPESEPLRWDEARRLLESRIGPEKLREIHRAVLPAVIARDLDEPAIRRLLRESWTREQRFPLTMMIALRPALRHMGLHFFKAGGNQTFVTTVAPSAIDADHAIEPIRNMLRDLSEHPGAHRDDLAAHVLGEQANDETARKELFAHLQWLIEKGHVIEFFDGALSVPRTRKPASPPRPQQRPARPQRRRTPDAARKDPRPHQPADVDAASDAVEDQPPG